MCTTACHAVSIYTLHCRPSKSVMMIFLHRLIDPDFKCQRHYLFVAFILPTFLPRSGNTTPTGNVPTARLSAIHVGATNL
jgi:hypothetical protein